MLPTIEPGIKIAVQASPEPSEEELALHPPDGRRIRRAVDRRRAGQRRVLSPAGASCSKSTASRVYGFGNRDVHNQDAIVLGLEGRDAKIEEYKQHSARLGQAGIPYTTYAHMANGIWSTEREATRGGASARAFDQAKGEEGHWLDERYRTAPDPRPRLHGRGDLGQLRVLHPPGGAGGRGRGRQDRHPPGRPARSASWAASRAASSAASTATSARLRSPTARTSACACAWAAGSRAAR